MKSKVSPGFIYDKRFGTWHRVLAKVGACHGAAGDMVVLEITPQRPQDLKSWRRTVQFPILLIEPDRAINLEIHESLPILVYKMIKKNLGASGVDRLIHEDVLKKIDWYKYADSNSCLLKHFRLVLEEEVRPTILFELEVKDSRDPGGEAVARVTKIHAASLERAIEIYYSSPRYNKEYRMVLSATLLKD